MICKYWGKTIERETKHETANLGGGGSPFQFPFGFVVKFALIVPKNDIVLLHSALETSLSSTYCCFS